VLGREIARRSPAEPGSHAAAFSVPSGHPRENSCLRVNLDPGVEESRMKHHAFMGLAAIRPLDPAATGEPLNPSARRPL